MKKLILAAATAALALGALTGCGSSESASQQPVNEVDEYIGVCLDADTQNRVEDSKCDPNNESPRYHPYFYSYGSVIPALGYPVMGGYPTVYAPYYMGFATLGGSSTNYQPKAPMAYPKGYVAPPNAVYKKATPSTTPIKSASEAAAKYSAPKSNSTGTKTSPNSSTDSKSSTKTAPKSNPYSYKGNTSSKSSTSSRSSSSSRK